jgi:taurine dioxygenase
VTVSGATKEPEAGSVEVIPQRSALGAEVRGVDLRQALDEARFAEIRAALAEHKVLFFRGQEISPEQQVAFSRRFGPLERPPLSHFALESNPDIVLISNIEENGVHIGIHDAGTAWHADSSYMEAPSSASLLYAKEVPRDELGPLGDTMFVPTDIVDTLTAETQRKLEGLKAVHRMDRGKMKSPDEKPPQAVHPVVITHPATHRKCLFVNEGRTIGFLGMGEAEGRMLLADLLSRIMRPERSYRHRWQAGDLLVWDNLATQHFAIHDYSWPQQKRLMYRTTVQGRSFS